MAESLPCPSWIWSNNSNVHAAKDRTWFGADYTPFDSMVGSMAGETRTPVVGIGTVELPVKRSPSATGPRSHGILRLRNVLHISTLICNIIGSPILDEYTVHTGFDDKDTKGTIKDKHSRSAAYFDPRIKPFQVRLSGPPIGPRVGPAPFEVSKLYVINVLWADSEREKWEDHRASEALQQAEEVGPLTTEEKQFLKDHWGNEFKFLMSHGLNINKDDDREEGRVVLRAIMAGSDSDDSDSGLDDPNEYRPEVQLAESYFDADQVKFINKHYGDPLTFMITFGLKFYKADDCQEARSIVESLMYPDSDE
ncbi:uncharacterized protein FIESC28_09089 [Fusarium coffeatum]|uniref:Uncharacterized protein n=1 Tax=Fusarium coffeatum TaxID=231269 RepID=A0A366R4V3_9HYPO|nr:uncharacterized protein FIESC28_09089 [Fusarium coffeatum]RBR11205.1 hypothetical protein FIESC28_09089 [Fusarium coffeatum]